MSDKLELDTSHYESFGDITVEFKDRNNIVLGDCICCGGVEMINVTGNIILTMCDKTLSKTTCANNTTVRCFGKDDCTHTDKFDDEEQTRRLKIVEDAIQGLFDTRYARIVVADSYSTRWVIAKRYMLDDLYIIRWIKSNDGTKYIVVILDHETLDKRNNRKKKLELIKKMDDEGNNGSEKGKEKDN